MDQRVPASRQSVLVHLRLRARVHGDALRDHELAVRRCAEGNSRQLSPRGVCRSLGQALRAHRLHDRRDVRRDRRRALRDRRPNCRPPTPRSGATAGSKSSTSAPSSLDRHSPDLTGPQDHVRTGVDLVDLFPDDAPRRVRRAQRRVRGDDARARPGRASSSSSRSSSPTRHAGWAARGVPAARDRRRRATARSRSSSASVVRGRRSGARRARAPGARRRRPPASSTSAINELVDRRLADRPPAGGRRARLDDAARHRRPRRRLRPGAHRGAARRSAAPPPARSRCTSPAASRCTTSARSRTTPPRTPPATCCSRARCRTSRSSVYTGLIQIREHAKGSDAFQTNRNLTLSEGAWAESVPNLDIETNDVKCSHASTVGPIDEEQRFYLESRGVPPEVAERLVVLGFFDEVLEQLPVGDARRRAAPRASPPSSTSGSAAVTPRERRRSCAARRPRVRHGAARSMSTASPVAVVRIDDDVYAIGDVCSHANVSLARARCGATSGRSSARSTAARSASSTGEPATLPATQPVPVFDVRGRRRRRRDVIDRVDQRGERGRDARSRSRACAPPSAARRSSTASTSTVSSRRGARRDGPERRRQEHAVGGRHGQARLRGARRLGHARRRRRARDAGVGARRGRAAPRDAVPDRGARRAARSTCCAEALAARGPADRRTSTRCSRAEARRIGFDERFLHRPLNVDLSGGEKKRNETLQLAVLRAADRHPRRARLRPRHRRPARLRPARSRRRSRRRRPGLGVLAITHYNRLLDELRPDHVHILVEGPHRRRAAAPSWPTSSRSTATPRSCRRRISPSHRCRLGRAASTSCSRSDHGGMILP